MKIAVTSDVHIGRKEALVDEFEEAISVISKDADIIILAGDIVDNDEDSTRNAFKEFLQLAKKEHFFEKLFFIYGGMKHEIKILHSFPGLLLNDYCLLSTAIGRILVIHGNNIGLYYDLEKGENAKLGAERAKRNLIAHPVNWLPRISENDHLVIGHLHKRFYHEPARIYCTGCWLPTNDSQNDTGYVLIIDDCNINPFQGLKFTDLLENKR